MAPYAAHSALEPAGIQAAHVLRLFYAYFDVCAVVFTLVIAGLSAVALTVAAIALLLLVAMVGVILLSKKDLK